MIRNPSSTLYTPGIIYRRIDNSLKNFFEDLKVLCKNKHWQYEPYVKESNGKRHKWKNNLVQIEQIEEYDDGRAKGFLFTFFIPSPIGPGLLNKPENLTDNPPVLGYKHKIYVSLPFNYPSVSAIESRVQRSDTLYIETRSQLFHPRFYLREKTWGSIIVTGEIDKIAMNLFQQLLWEPSHVIWEEDPEHEPINNQQAINWVTNYGSEPIHQFLLSKMNDQWGWS